jgi:hypothetical protein
MNDYYPFLVQKVSKLESESRRKVYESAREELITKLARPALRVPEAEIAGERRAFEAAIQRIEAESARGDISEAGALDPMTPQTSLDSPVSAQITRIESESTPTILVGEAGPETSAPTISGIVPHEEQRAEKWQTERGLPQANSTDRTSRAEDIRVLPRHAAHDFDLKFDRRTPGVVVAQTMRKQLISMIFVIVVCCLVFAVIYFSTSIGKWLGI